MKVGTRLGMRVNAMKAVMVHAGRQGLICTAIGGLLKRVRTVKIKLCMECSCSYADIAQTQRSRRHEKV